MTTDGIKPILPNNSNVFRLTQEKDFDWEKYFNFELVHWKKNISTYCITGSAFYSSNLWLSQSICFKDTYEHSLNYLGLADLGQSRGYENDDPYDYNHEILPKTSPATAPILQ